MKSHVCRRRSLSFRRRKRSLSWSLKPIDPSAKSRTQTQSLTPTVTSRLWVESRLSLWTLIFLDLQENHRVAPSSINPSPKLTSHLRLQPPLSPAYLWNQSLFTLLSSSLLHLWPLWPPAWSSATPLLHRIPALRLHPKLSISPALIVPASLLITLSHVASLIAAAAAVEISQITLSIHQPSSPFNFSSAEGKSVYDFQKCPYYYIQAYICYAFTCVFCLPLLMAVINQLECIIKIQKHQLKVMCVTFLTLKHVFLSQHSKETNNAIRRHEPVIIGVSFQEKFFCHFIRWR